MEEGRQQEPPRIEGVGQGSGGILHNDFPHLQSFANAGGSRHQEGEGREGASGIWSGGRGVSARRAGMEQQQQR